MKNEAVGTQLEKPAFALIMGRLLAFTVTFFIPVVLIRLFDQAQFGTYKQIFVVYSTLAGMAQLGMSQSLYYFLPGEPRNGGRYVVNSMMVLAFSGLLILVLFDKTGWLISRWLSNAELSRYLTALGLYLLLMLMSAFLEIVMISRKRFRLASLSYFLSDLLRGVLMIVPVLIDRRLESLVWGAVAFAAARLGLTLIYLRGEYNRELRFDARLLWSQILYALPFQAYVIADALQSNLHHYVVSHRFDAATFAIYSIGCLQVPLVDFIATPVGDVMMVNMGEAKKDGRSKDVLALWHNATRKLAMLFFPLMVVLILTARELITFLFTASYAASVPIFMFWSASILLAAFQTDAVMRVHAETRFLLLLNLIRVVLIAAFISWFLSSFHLLGGVLITLLASLVAKIIALAKIGKLMRVTPSQIVPWGNLGKIAAIAAFAGVPALIFKSLATIPTLPLLLGTTCMYCSFCLFLLIRFGPLDAEERLLLIGWLRRLASGAIKARECQSH